MKTYDWAWLRDKFRFRLRKETLDVFQDNAQRFKLDSARGFTLDLGAVPYLKLHTHLPVIVDPSHASGDRRLVEPLSRAAAAVGADGIIVEVAMDPEAALCDGPQQLYASDFQRFAQSVAGHASLVGRRLA